MKTTSIVAIAAVAVLLCAGIYVVAAGDDDGDKEIIAVSMPWQKEMLDEIAGEGAFEVYLLIPPGVSPHDPSQVSVETLTKLKAAKAWFMVGDELGIEAEMAIYDKVKDDIGAGKIHKATDGMTLIEGGHEHEEDEHDDEEEGAYDMHVWCSPENLLIAASNARDALIALDPSNADAYDEGCESYSEKVREIQALADTALKAIHGKMVMVWHEAWGYLLSKEHIVEFSLQDLVGHSVKELTVTNIMTLNGAISEQGQTVMFAAPDSLIMNSGYRGQIGITIEEANAESLHHLQEMRNFLELLDKHKGEFPADPAHGHS
ncbi:MAG: zinc ABC transporter substrate-binding protein [Candidatus Methanoplasma sp.]|jgi:ABC-type Zn uptake system ZnuABC Zn-binding protein ZnuA|nr:zinc ABC transporter substrate-binding protein [Candidatus Methanoplasma sp.]